MRQLIVIALLLFPLGGFAKLFCVGACPSGCIFYTIEYEVDCNGDVTEYRSHHFYGDHVEVNDEVSRPEFIGMNPSDLGCATNVCS